MILSVCMRVRVQDTVTPEVQKVPKVQNAAARFVTGARQSDHITLVRQRIRYKIGMLVHKCLNGRASQFVIDECRWAGGRRSGTRSAGHHWKSSGAICQSVTVHSLQLLAPQV